MTAPLPDFDLTDFDDWIKTNLGTDGEDTDPAWKSRLLPDRPSRVVGNANPVRYIQVIVVPEFTRTLSALAAERGLSRESLIRLVLVDAVAKMTGQDRDVVLGNMPPRRPTLGEYRRKQ